MRAQNDNELLANVELANSAILVVDVQNDWCHEDGAYAKGGNDATILQQTIPRVENLLTKAQKSEKNHDPRRAKVVIEFGLWKLALR